VLETTVITSSSFNDAMIFVLDVWVPIVFG
jgi:hypothetical protein